MAEDHTTFEAVMPVSPSLPSGTVEADTEPPETSEKASPAEVASSPPLIARVDPVSEPTPPQSCPQSGTVREPEDSELPTRADIVDRMDASIRDDPYAEPYVATEPLAPSEDDQVGQRGEVHHTQRLTRAEAARGLEAALREGSHAEGYLAATLLLGLREDDQREDPSATAARDQPSVITLSSGSVHSSEHVPSSESDGPPKKKARRVSQLGPEAINPEVNATNEGSHDGNCDEGGSEDDGNSERDGDGSESDGGEYDSGVWVPSQEL